MIDQNTLKTFSTLASVGIPFEEAANNMAASMRTLPPINPDEAEALIRANPTLSRFQRWRLVRELRRMKKAEQRS